MFGNQGMVFGKVRKVVQKRCTNGAKTCCPRPALNRNGIDSTNRKVRLVSPSAPQSLPQAPARPERRALLFPLVLPTRFPRAVRVAPTPSDREDFSKHEDIEQFAI